MLKHLLKSEGCDNMTRHRHTYYWGGIKWHEEVMEKNVKERVKKVIRDLKYYGERKGQWSKEMYENVHIF